MFFCGRRADKGAEIAAQKDNVHFIQADVNVRDDLVRFFDTAKTQGGSIDVIVANAGIEGKHATNILSEEFWPAYDEVMKVNLTSVIDTARIGIPYFDSEKGAHFLVMSSVNSSIPVPGFGPYCMSKAGCDALVRCLNAETPDNIKVYGLNPYLIQSELTERLCATFNVPDVATWAEGTNPSGKVGTGADLGKLIIDVVTVKEAKYETEFPPGSSLLTDGHVLFHAREAMPLGDLKGTPEFDEKIKNAAI